MCTEPSIGDGRCGGGSSIFARGYHVKEILLDFLEALLLTLLVVSLLLFGCKHDTNTSARPCSTFSASQAKPTNDNPCSHTLFLIFPHASRKTQIAVNFLVSSWPHRHFGQRTPPCICSAFLAARRNSLARVSRFFSRFASRSSIWEIEGFSLG
jgi:hypothetical protein